MTFVCIFSIKLILNCYHKRPVEEGSARNIWKERWYYTILIFWRCISYIKKTAQGKVVKNKYALIFHVCSDKRAVNL